MSPTEIADLVSALDAGRRGPLARALSIVEDQRPGFEALLAQLHDRVGPAFRVGITGPPGAGKSTLTEAIVRAYRARDLSVAVVAVDPSSPFSGGALLGDRIRMESVSLDDAVFIRSMATRGGTGGLAATTREVCDVLDAAGFERILIETVGVGQAEWAVVSTADSSVLVLVPESGDGVQVLKAGVMETADLYVVNKADRPGADHLTREVRDMLTIRLEQRDPAAPKDAWDPVVVSTVALRGEGVPALVDAIEAHREALIDTGALETGRRERLIAHTQSVVERACRRRLWASETAQAQWSSGLPSVLEGRVSPYELAKAIVDRALRAPEG